MAPKALIQPNLAVRFNRLKPVESAVGSNVDDESSIRGANATMERRLNSLEQTGGASNRDLAIVNTQQFQSVKDISPASTDQ